jgi:hypothetical protein
MEHCENEDEYVQLVNAFPRDQRHLALQQQEKSVFSGSRP